MLDFYDKSLKFFNAFYEALKFEGAILQKAQGKTRDLSVSLVEIEQKNLQHTIEKTSGLNKDIASQLQAEKIIDYLKRCEEILLLKQHTMQLNAFFIPIPVHQKLYERYTELLKEVQTLLTLSIVKNDLLQNKSWLNNRLRSGFNYRRLTINTFGLKSDPHKKALAEQDLYALQTELEQEPPLPPETKTTQKLVGCEAHIRNFPNSFHPALSVFRNTPKEKFTTEELEKIRQAPPL